MFKFQKILVSVYILAQASLQYYLYSQLKFQKQSANEDSSTLIWQLLPHIVVACIVIILFMAVHLKNPGCIVIDNKDAMHIDQDHNADVNNNNLDNNKINGNKQDYQINDIAGPTQRSIFSDNPNKNFKNPFSSFKIIANNQATNLNAFCHICQIYQPYRTKHCHQCDTCVATYDHHCPWMNTCIGQKNRHIFYIFLLLQVGQTFSISVAVASIAINSQHLNNKQIASILAVALILFLTLLLVLLCFHSYLMAKNTTTWQFMKAEQIAYMNTNAVRQYKDKRNDANDANDANDEQENNVKKRRMKKQVNKYSLGSSPFCKGTMRNIWEYWTLGFKQQRKVWEFDIKH